MKYLALIYSEHDRWASSTPDEKQAVYDEFVRFADEAGRRGKLGGGAELDATTTATTVRVRNDETMVTDGPFAETKEQLGGYFLLDCDNLDEAIELAAKIPTARHGSIELRPLMEREGPPA
ncbi:MAG: hypothetical protein QOE36_2077 [Gaiellaceae bacterium]|nr:hypothetical protein [Gaiellaceae bacterium]